MALPRVLFFQDFRFLKILFDNFVWNFISFRYFCILRNYLWLKTTIFFSALSGGATKRGNATAERGNENSQRGSGKILGFRA